MTAVRFLWTRVRISRELHDLLGRSLSAIVLKSELAGKLLARAPQQASPDWPTSSAPRAKR